MHQGKRRLRRHRDLAAIADAFDEPFYLSQLPESVQLRGSPLSHFYRQGWKQGLDPNREFSTALYLERYPDVKAAGLNPLWHFITRGQGEGRVSFPSLHSENAQSLPALTQAVAAEFDAAFYLAANPDIAASGEDPLTHFMTLGWREGRDPTPGFSTRYYIDNNPDIQQSGTNPFWHYIVAGRGEGRAPRHPAGDRARILAELVPLREQAQIWMLGYSDPPRAAPEDLRAALDAAMAKDNGQALIGISHDNYRAVSGGTQLVQTVEEEAARAAGMSYINLHPAAALPTLASDPAPLLQLMVNGHLIGALDHDLACDLLAPLTGQGRRAHLAIHSGLGHAPEAVLDIARALQVRAAWYWMHDYLSLCCGFTLQRNNVAYCGLPPKDSPACGICVYGPDRAVHLDRMRALFQALPMHVVAPSEVTRALFETHADLPYDSLHVLPHLTLHETVRPAPKAPADGPVRIAYVGAPVPFKGWEVFCELASRFAADPRYAFHYFGASESGVPGSVKRTRVMLSDDGPAAMIAALETAEIDFMLNWSSSPETFSFTTHEALAAGAYVLTNRISGNVSAVVADSGRGRVLADTDALDAFLSGADALDLAQEVRTRRARNTTRIARSRKSVALIEAAQDAP